MAKTLELIFTTTTGKDVTLTVDEPRADVTDAELLAGMQAIITQDVFEVEGSSLSTVKGARIVERNIVEYEV
ncbi:hypothetical protein BBH88_12790 [Planococcus antarcticus DSM 14505]|uniref:DUF2922 domain-containing protein n=1 Tax=Planococcus antarcticus DSM 14505 TaxID=1185653 RepID=A0ABM6D711_9BACL|nr:DUF2922 domain-containing protein [Planococcus antarcticus]ANU11110.1 hypothetical protein BBH88_12790 [Planococcus antarcticus DSM 14505]